MSDDEVVQKINSQLSVVIALQIMASCVKRLEPDNQRRVSHLQAMARLFTVHVLKLLVTHRMVVARWVDARLPEPRWVKEFEVSEVKLR